MFKHATTVISPLCSASRIDAIIQRAWLAASPAAEAANKLIRLPAGDGKDTPIDPRDIAAVAVKVLTTPGHEGKIYELTGPELLSHAEMVEKIAAATGRPLKYVDVPEATARPQAPI